MFCAKCDDFTVEEWGTDLCNWNNFPSMYAPEKIPRCRCQDMSDAGEVVGEQEITNVFNQALADLRAMGVMGPECDVLLVIKRGEDKCVEDLRRTFALFCPNATNQNGPHIVCIPQSLSKCEYDLLIIHEVIHAAQSCNGEGLAAPSRGPREKEANQILCEQSVKRSCVPPNKQDEAVRNCIRIASSGSVNPANTKEFGKACNKLFRGL